jgi:hypothetical protein
MNGVKKMKVMARLIWSMTLLAILSVVSPIAASNLRYLPYIYCGQTQPSNAYDGTSVLSDDYDSATTSVLSYMKTLLMQDGDVLAGELDRKILKKISK